MKIASLVAGAVVATALATSAFADAPKSSNAISITFTSQGKTLCVMTLTEPTKGALVGKASGTGCPGGLVAGFITGSGATQLIDLAMGAKGFVVDFVIEVAKKSFIAVEFNGSKPGAANGTVTIK